MSKEPIKFRISKTPDYQEWLDIQSATSKTQIENRVSLIECYGHLGVVEYSPTLELLNEDLIARAVWECLKDNDPEGVAEVIHIYLDAKERARTFYPNIGENIVNSYKIKSKKTTLKALAKMVHASIER